MAQCVFIFVVSGFPSFQSDLEWDEELLLHFYGKPLEYTAEGELSLFFNLAVKVETGPGSRIINHKYPGFLLVSGWQTGRASLHGHVQPVPAGDRGHEGHSPQTRTAATLNDLCLYMALGLSITSSNLADRLM